MMMHQALLAPPLFLGRVAKRLKGPNSAKVMVIFASALVISFVGLLLADSQVEHINLNVGRETKEKFQVEGCWSLAIVAYLAFVSVVSVMRTQVISIM